MRKLTVRELEVARLKASGLADKEIANELGISYGTVRTHIDKMCLKVNAVNITQAIALLINSNKI